MDPAERLDEEPVPDALRERPITWSWYTWLGIGLAAGAATTLLLTRKPAQVVVVEKPPTDKEAADDKLG